MNSEPTQPLTLCRYADVRAALMESRFAIHKPLGGDNAPPEEDDEFLKRSRRVAPLSQILADHLSSPQLAVLSGFVERQTEQMLAAGLARGGMDLVMDLAYPLPLMVMMRLLGLPPGDFAPFAPLFTAITAGHDLGCTEQDRKKAGFALHAIGVWLRDRIATSAASPLQGAIQSLAKAGNLPEQVSLYWMAMLLYAGSTTTRDFLANMLVALLEWPDAVDQLEKADDATLKRALEELVRLEGPVRMVGRVARTALQCGGRDIPRGAVVYLDLEQANRDPAQFADPLDFRLDRSPNPHLGFGTGTTFCLGAHLARMEAMTVLRAFLPHLRRMRIESPVEWSGSRVLRERPQVLIRFG